MTSSKQARFGDFLNLSNATFRLGDRLVFEKTSWTFRRDEQWAVIGPNGSGKSLFGDALRGKLPLVAGEMTYHFKGVAGSSPEECIGHVAFQERKTELHGTVLQSRWNSMEEHASGTVADFLSYQHVMGINPFEVRDDDSDSKKAFTTRSRRAVDLLEVRPFLSRELLSLSNGESQKVHLARALSLPLRLLILDEPFVGLDAASRAHFRDVLETLMEASLKVLLITTHLDDLPRTITHCLYVDNCRVVDTADSFSSSSGREPVDLPERGRARDRGRGRVREETCLPPLVELRNVTVRYGSATILDRINWSIFPGASWALLGPNGSGKTTLLSLIAGDHPQAYNNEIIVFGKRRGEGDSIWELKRQIGWVSPELHLHFDETITCYEAVGSGFHDAIGLFAPLTRAQRKATMHWLERFGLKRLSSTPLFGLSIGEQRLVLLARALVKQPRLLILDEPCQGLDAAHTAMFIDIVDGFISAGKETAIYVTHRQEEIPPSIKQVLILP